MFSLFTLFADCSTKPTFFGLEPWYQYLNLKADKSGECGVVNFYLLPSNGHASSVPLVLLAIIDDLLRLVGLMAVGFIIYGGIQFITSQGSPDGTSKARSTVINALIGVAVASVAVAVVSYIGTRLQG